MSASGLDELYREVILDHYRSPHGAAPIDDPNVEVEGHNPLCGDELIMHLDIVDGQIRSMHIEPRGCSISVASASMLAQQLEALDGVKNFPVRIKCALLAWMTLEQALAEYDHDLVGEVVIDRDIEVVTRKS